MTLLEGFLLFYVLPSVILSIGLYFDNSIQTIRDYLKSFRYSLFPILNIVFILGLSLIYTVDKIKETKLSKQFGLIGKRILDAKLKN